MTCDIFAPGLDELRDWSDQAAAFVQAAWRDVDHQPSWDLDGVEAVAQSFVESLPENGASFESLLRRLEPAFAKSFNTPGPGYLAYIPGGGIPSAALAGFIALGLNRYVGVNRAAPALCQIERTAIRWLAESVGYAESAGGILTTGGSLSNLTAIVTAREAILGENFHDAVIYASDQTHASVFKAARIAGFAERSLRWVRSDRRFRLDVDCLEEAMAQDAQAGRRPFLVVVNAGTTNTGALAPSPMRPLLRSSMALGFTPTPPTAGCFGW